MDKEIVDIDPDEGLEVREEVAALLRKSAMERISGQIVTISFEEAFDTELSSQNKNI